MFDRRRFLQALAALGATATVPAYTQEKPRWGEAPFALGVASGYPSPNGVVLWTRLVVDPTQPHGGIDPVKVRVNWEIARDDKMTDIVASGYELLVPAWAHSIHVNVNGLEPDRPYWYRFTSGNADSPIGRTRTAPAWGAPSPRLKFAFASCQHFEEGYFSAYRHMLADDLDFVAFLGCYIHGTHTDKDSVRSHNSPEPKTLSDYRVRHSLYRSDPDLRAAHAALPWILTWDDEEVASGYAADVPQEDIPHEQWVARRLVAYKAYYEHMPLLDRTRFTIAGMRLCMQFGWGALARFFILDLRQYRTPQACRPVGRGGASVVDVADCQQLLDPERTLLGDLQQGWLHTALELTPARWNVLTQHALMAQFDLQLGPGRRVWTDGWDGYPLERKKLLEFMARKKTPNPISIGGDMDAFYVSDLKTNFDNPKAPVMGSEFVGTSISERGWPQERIDQFLPKNPHVRFADSRYRGYVRVEVTPRQWRADLRAMETVLKPGGACSTLASFVVEDGVPGARRV